MRSHVRPYVFGFARLLLNEFGCYKVKIEKSEKAGSHRKSNPGHLWLDPPVQSSQSLCTALNTSVTHFLCCLCNRLIIQQISYYNKSSLSVYPTTV